MIGVGRRWIQVRATSAPPALSDTKLVSPVFLETVASPATRLAVYAASWYA